MRILLISFVVIFSHAGCGSSPDTDTPSGTETSFQFNLREGRWSITIPVGFIIEDSAAFMQRLEKTPYQEPLPGVFSSTLLYVYDSSGLGDTIHHSLSLDRIPVPDTFSFEKHLKVSTDYALRTYNLDKAFQHLVSNRLDTVNIGGRKFIVEHYIVKRGADTVIFRYYHSHLARQLLTANLLYYQLDTLGKKLKTSLENSRIE